jgi:molybdopterin-guanine dinucleotide biosynthesis protein A
MGGREKALITLDGRTLLEHAIDRLAPQVGPLLLNANGDPARFARFGLPVRADVIEGFGGPLVGLLTGMEWAAEVGAEWVVTVPADTPLFPRDLVERLAAAGSGGVSMATSGGQLHPVFGLWPVRLHDALRHALADGERKVQTFAERYGLARVDWPAQPADPFFNANTPGELEQLPSLARRLADGDHTAGP